MKHEIIEIKTYEVSGFKFETNGEAEDFLNSNTLVFDNCENTFVALANKDIDRWNNTFKCAKEDFFKMYRDLCNSNSMGSLYPLRVCNYVMQINDVNQDEVWGQ